MKKVCIYCKIAEPAAVFRRNASTKKQSGCRECIAKQQLASRQARWESDCKKFGIATMRFITGRNKR